MLPPHPLVLQHPRLPRLERSPGRQVVPPQREPPFTSTERDALLGSLPIHPPSPSPQELTATCPDAGIILVERDVEACSMSFEQSDHPAVVEPVSEPPRRLGSVDHGPRAGYATHFQWIRGWSEAESKGEMPRDVYRDHYELVRRITPPDR